MWGWKWNIKKEIPKDREQHDIHENKEKESTYRHVKKENEPNKWEQERKQHIT